MAKSIVGICNMALGRIGISRYISDIDEPSNEARVCRVFYESTRDRVLSDFDWNFATSYAPLQDIGTSPTGWLYRYRYPNNCMKACKVMETPESDTDTEPPGVPFVVVEDETAGELAICCNILTPTLKFTRQVVTPGLFSWSFINALAWALAAELAIPLAAQPGYATAANNAYTASLVQGMARNLNEAKEQPVPESDFLKARR